MYPLPFPDNFLDDEYPPLNGRARRAALRDAQELHWGLTGLQGVGYRELSTAGGTAAAGKIASLHSEVAALGEKDPDLLF